MRFPSPLPSLPLLLIALSLLAPRLALATELKKWVFTGSAAVVAQGPTRLDLLVGEDPAGRTEGAATLMWLGFWYPGPGTATQVPSDANGPARDVRLQVFYAPSGARTIRFELPNSDDVTLDMFDLQGRLVRGLWSGKATAGAHDITFDGFESRPDHFASGIYFLRLRSGKVLRHARMINFP